MGSLGRLHPHKGYDLLIKAMAELQRKQPELARDFTVTIGAEGPDRKRLEHLARARDLTNLNFAGYQEDARRFLASPTATCSLPASKACALPRTKRCKQGCRRL